MQAAHELQELVAGQSTDLGRACTGRKSRIRRIDIHRHIHGTLHPLVDFAEDLGYAFFDHFMDRDRARPKRGRVGIIVLAADRTADADLDILSLPDPAFIQRMTKWCSMAVWHSL